MTGTIDMTYDEIVERDLESELRCLREELAEWRSGKRRVFWRGYRMGSPVAAREFVRLDDAREWISGQEDYGKGLAKLYRVTVRTRVKP